MWAMELTTIEDCDLFESKFLSPTEFSQNEVFKAFDIIVNFLHIIASFLILLALNIIIIREQQHSHRTARTETALMSALLVFKQNNGDLGREKLERFRLRAAINTTVVIISAYLACNSLHFCLFIIEQFDPSWLLNEAGDDFNSVYVMLGDFVSVLFVVSSMIRLPIYYKFNLQIRGQIDAIFGFKNGRKYSSND
ncbi:unnamed protein product [Dracunculus medinensis]|uniref:G_PROTEIN_RECEP_F1_2 domain-containing protein n=1 Tax=Dracunculus medinensis TaxID=318479 RepID=A0A0N4U3U7_DRAME|nr:unnamed protein product [Dracunculus medinensis]